MTISDGAGQHRAATVGPTAGAVVVAVVVGAATAFFSAAADDASGAVMSGIVGILVGALVAPLAALSAGYAAMVVVLAIGGVPQVGDLVGPLAILAACGFGIAYNQATRRVAADITRRLRRDPESGHDTAQALKRDLLDGDDKSTASLTLVDIPDLEAAGPCLDGGSRNRMVGALVERLGAGPDTIGVYRVGSARLAVLGRGVMTHEKAIALRDRLSLPLPIEGSGMVSPGIVLGWANGQTGPEHGPTLERSAEAALSQATKHRIAGDECAQGSADFHLAAHLRDAFDAGELAGFYQRKVDLESGKEEGCEILIRWPGAPGEVNPGVLVEIAERFGMTDRVLDIALAAAARVAPAISGRVAVNLSGCDLVTRVDIDRIFDRAAAEGLGPDKLEFEITETALEGLSRNTTIDLLGEIRARGARVALDDFGVGDSSLEHLVSWPADVVKIDRQFVRNVLECDKAAAIIAGLAATAEQLGIELVAEGVETDEQAAWLRHSGIHRAQGYLFHRPASVTEISD